MGNKLVENRCPTDCDCPICVPMYVSLYALFYAHFMPIEELPCPGYQLELSPYMLPNICGDNFIGLLYGRGNLFPKFDNHKNNYWSLFRVYSVSLPVSSPLLSPSPSSINTVRVLTCNKLFVMIVVSSVLIAAYVAV